MGIKEILSKIKGGVESQYRSSKKEIDLNAKVEKFIKWYRENILKNYDEKGRYFYSTKLRNFIEKMAVWYELRYPDYEVLKKVHHIEESTSVSDIMFNQNKYVNEQLMEDSDTRILDWDAFYNANAFISALSGEEKEYFKKAKYPRVVYWGLGSARLHLTNRGYVECAEYMDCVIPGILNSSLEGKHITEVVNLIKEKGIEFPKNNEFLVAIRSYVNRVYQKEEMLNCVMYRIIERGGKKLDLVEHSFLLKSLEEILISLWLME